MKQIKLIGFLCGIFMLLAFGCEKNNNDFPAEFTFRLLDILGNKATTFSEGENNYYSAFSASFNVDGSVTDVKNFKVEFTVK